MRRSQKKRIEFIESRLYWEGKISRKDLTDYFEISIPQATKDIKAYIEEAPGNIFYDNSAKLYIPSDKFTPALISPDSELYLNRLHSTDYGSEYFFFGAIPNSYMLPTVKRKIDPSILRPLLNSIRNNNAINIKYQSMSNPKPSWRWVTPQAIGFDGFRWHTRAFCHNSKIYKDFNLGRILTIGAEKEHPLDHSNDFAWFNTITFEIAPHKELSDGQKVCVEFDYCMENGKLNFDVKAAFTYYVIKSFGFGVKHHEKPANEQQVVLLNRQEIITQKKIMDQMSQKKMEDTVVFKGTADE
jgi:hypothetical protein